MTARPSTARVAAALCAALLLGSCALFDDGGGGGGGDGGRGRTTRGVLLHPDRFAGTFNGFCDQREEDGFQERASLRVVDRKVQALSWQTVVDRRGSCAFDLDEFRQTRTQPHLELAANDGTGCRLLVYQDARRVTLAHANCSRRCTPGIYDQAWPVMFDPASGRCATLDR